MKLNKIKKEWVRGFSITWRVLLLIFLVRFIYEIGVFATMMFVGMIGNEPLLELIFGLFALLGILVFPLVVAILADSIDLKVSQVDFPLSRKVKSRPRRIDRDSTESSDSY